jgi:hypothetical protein
VVDVGRSVDLPRLRERGEVVELPYWLAMKAGMNGYRDGVRIWVLEGNNVWQGSGTGGDDDGLYSHGDGGSPPRRRGPAFRERLLR